ncbi:MAG TPA: thiamine pyrophosphate-requiring protein [Alphaproteobacteria bacterium]|jgi:acetolactate synthase-1/2/3 large subunit|nr:thiamine pyrophosphate-requiring protein [Alphaproteobacteria bacterium]
MPDAGKTSAQQRIDSGTVADVYLQLLADRGIEYLFANAGTDFAPLIESYAKALEKGTPAPKPITCPHENVAMSMAMGYYAVTQRMAAVMVHVNVGTANSLCGLINSFRGNIPILFSAGRTPYTEGGMRTGRRTGEIHWPQEMRDQAAMLREVVKWDYELRDADGVETAVDRALAIAMSEPRGPVYLTLPREVLAGDAAGLTISRPARYTAASAPYPDPAAVAKAAAILAKAENPLIITSSFGVRPEEVAVLAHLCETFAIPVSQRKPRYVCLPSDHSMHLGYNPDPMLDAADAIIVLDCDVPWIPGKKSPKADCPVIHIGSDPLLSSYPLRGFPIDVAITGLSGATLAALDAELRGKMPQATIDSRRKRLGEQRAKQRERWKADLEKCKGEVPIHPSWFTHCLNQVKGADDIIIKESPITPEHLDLTKPGTYFSIGAGGGLGWGLGTALGAKIADRKRRVICTVGDGAYMFGNPIPAHYTAKAEKLPTLTVVFNNEMWGAVKRNTREVYPDGYAARSNREPLTYFEPGTKFEKAIEICDGYGERVEKPADVPKAIERGLKAVDSGRPALINLICRGP